MTFCKEEDMNLDMKYAKGKVWSWRAILLRSRRGRPWTLLSWTVALIILAGVSTLTIIFSQGESFPEDGAITNDVITPGLRVVQWNYSSYHFQPRVSQWDKQREAWFQDNPTLRPVRGGRPRVLMVTGSSPRPCKPAISSHLLLKAAKNKIDYCRMHEIELYYSLGNPDPQFTGWWVKVSLVRMLMLQHPEMDWIWWLDADAILTDLSFEPPFGELINYNLVLYGNDHFVYDVKDWTGVNTGDYFIRNCQWSLDLIDAWASMGRTSIRQQSGQFLTATLANRPSNFAADDQSALVALLTGRDKKNPNRSSKWAWKVKLVEESEYSLSGNWKDTAPKLEELATKYHPGFGDYRWPLVTHFAGCQPCNPHQSSEPWDLCVQQMGRTFDFADNQIFQLYGFKPRTLGSSEPLETRELSPAHVTEDVPREGFRMQPWISGWDEQREKWMENHPTIIRPEVMLVSGSAPKPCIHSLGNHLLLRAVKNKMDYGRLNNIEFFYNMAQIDKNLTGWWSKLPLIRNLMMKHPEVEWFWWMDSDAVFTDLFHKLPFERYNSSGYNLVLYGGMDEVYKKKSYSGINTGNFLIRNCQWSLDLLDKWASFGASEALRIENEALLNAFLDRPSGWKADDQSVLVYVLLTEREKWKPKVHFETTFLMSGEWASLTPKLDDMADDERPFVIHFAGCKPCEDVLSEKCHMQMDRAFNFADNQVLETYGLKHHHLSTTDLEKSFFN